MSFQLLNVWDYVIIGVLLTVSAVYGLYHGFYKVKDQSSFLEYTLASRQVSTFPIAVSSFATLVGSGMLIGSPVETYKYGSQPTLLFFSGLLVAPFINYIIIPIYRNLTCSSIFQFFELRYNVGFKNVITFSFSVTAIAVSSATLYGAATVLSLVTEYNVWLIVILLDVLCLIYTILGGMRAVIFADVIQGVFMLATIIGLVVLGVFHVGGIGNVWKRNLEGQRIEFFNFALDPTVRHTVWTSVVGWAFSMVSFMTSNQAIMQRYLSTETLQQAQNANVMSTVMMAFGQLFSFLSGLVAFAIFYKCDPIKEGSIENDNQLLPRIVMETFGEYSGFPGLYFTGLLSASLSTVSSLINSLASVTIESCIRPYFPKISEKSYTKYCRYFALFYGLIALLNVLLVQKFPNVLQATISITGAISGPTLGVMLIGMIFPQTNRKASMVAFSIGVAVCIWCLVGTLVGDFEAVALPFTTEGCPNSNLSLNSSLLNTSHPIEPQPMAAHWSEKAFPLSKMSFIWMSTLGVLVSSVLTVFATFVFDAEKREVCCLQFVPPVIQRLHKRLNRQLRRRLYCDIYPEEEETQTSINGAVPLLTQLRKTHL